MRIWRVSANAGKAIFCSHEVENKGSVKDSWCPLPAPVAPGSSTSLPPSKDISGESWIEKQVERLSAAVNVPTQSYDDNGDVDIDPRWRPFEDFHVMLRQLFPNVHEVADLASVNKYGLVYTVRGTSTQLKPIMLTAHQDVVPASFPDRWLHPPFEAYFDGKSIWGRGASDCKNNLIGILSTMELLLEKGWKPKRTVVLAFGFDEETGGARGAAKISEHLQQVWGKGGMELVIDEGGMGLSRFGNNVYARPGVAEKGYMDAVLTVQTTGGHSSRPPSPHIGIGIMSEVVVALEAHPYEPRLTKENPFRGFLQCQARYSPGQLEPWLRKALENDEHDIGVRLAEARGGEIRFSMQTSQAVTIIGGGNKVNALPESVTVNINYRIAPHDSLEVIKANTRKFVEPVVRKYNLEILDFDQSNTTASEVSAGSLRLHSVNNLRPAPISPSSVEDKTWVIFSGTIRSVFESAPTLRGRKVIPVGDIMLGNTDTIQY